MAAQLRHPAAADREGQQFSQDADPRYVDIGGGPLTECLADVVARFVPYFEGTIVPDLQGRQDGVDRRARKLAAGLVKYLDG